MKITPKVDKYKFNDRQFWKDLKDANGVLVYAEFTEGFFVTQKMEVKSEALKKFIHYKMTDEIYKSKRMVMVIL